MLYSSQFYFPFLVAALGFYWVVLRSSRARVSFLALGSMLFLIAAQIHSVSLEYATTAVGTLFALSFVVFRAGVKVRENPALLHLLLFISVPLSALLFFKYLSPSLQSAGLMPHVAVPLGVSYYTFKHTHYLIECSRGQFKEARFREYLAYIYFFPMFTAGPIERFNHFSEQSRAVKFNWPDISNGIERMLFGLVKKFVVADLVLRSLLPDMSMIEGGAQELGWNQVLLASFLRFLITYFDFSGYTDMVLGTGRFFGFRLMENFNFPLLRPNLTEFWRAWHMSLSSWARDYIYFPLLGKYRSTSVALLATMLMIGTWHSPAPGWALWGLHHGIGLVLLSIYHRWAQRRAAVQELRASVPWRVCSTLVTWWYVSIGYALTFEADAVGTSLALYAKIMTFGLAG